jgi:hypothetical protein
MRTVSGKPVRVIKRSQQERADVDHPRSIEKRTPAQVEREIAENVISWISERKLSEIAFRHTVYFKLQP